MRPRNTLLALLLLPSLTGCVAISMHSTRPVQIRVTERDSGKPVDRALVKVDYTYTGYGVFYIFRMPKGDSAATDESGQATLRMADFMADIDFRVNLQPVYVSKEMIRHGGVSRGDPSFASTQHFNERPIIVELIPTK